MKRKFSVQVTRCRESGRFVGTSDDIKGLVLEADTIGSLIDAARDVIPHLLKDNGQATEQDAVTVSVFLIVGNRAGAPSEGPTPRYVVEEKTADAVYA